MKPVYSKKSWVLVQMLSGLPLTSRKNEGNRRLSPPSIFAEKQNLKCNSLKRASSKNIDFLFSSARKWICNSEWFFSNVYENECVINFLIFISFIIFHHLFSMGYVTCKGNLKKTSFKYQILTEGRCIAHLSFLILIESINLWLYGKILCCFYVPCLHGRWSVISYLASCFKCVR